MHRNEADTLMERLLVGRGFDFAVPSLPAAWLAFTDFARSPLAGLRTVTIGVEFCQFDDRDDVLWVSFMRRFEEADGSGWSCGCLLSRTSPSALVRVQESRWWWAEHGTLEQWISEVEQMPAFVATSALDGWHWEGLSE